jgi:Flp pilus assembly protein TadD
MASLFRRFRGVFADSRVKRNRSTRFASGSSLLDIYANSDRLRNGGDLQQALSILGTVDQEAKVQVEYLRRAGILLYMLGRSKEAVEVLSRAVSIVTTDGESLKFLAGSLSSLGDLEGAIAAARSAAKLLPEDAQLRNALGAMCADAGQIEEAMGHFHAALALNPADLQPLANLEVLAARFGAAGFQNLTPTGIRQLRENVIATFSLQLRQGQLGLAETDLLCTLTSNREEYLDTANEIDRRFGTRADLPSGLEVGLGVICQNRGDLVGAIRHFEAAAQSDPLDRSVRNGLGSLYVTEGGDRWLQGWQALSATYRMLNPRNYPTRVPQWTGADLGSGKLFVHFDQGVGDALIGMRFLPHLVRQRHPAVLWLPPHLNEIAPLPGAGIEVVVSEEMPDPRALGCTAACGLLELVFPLGLAPSDIGDAPRLVLEPSRSQSWRDQLRRFPGRKIGLAALGNPNRIDDWLRSVKITELALLGELAGVTWVNLVIDDRPERDQLVDKLSMFDAAPLLKSFADTAALIDAVDAVISIDCATAHLAASLGKRLWVFQPTMLDWRWQIAGQDSPWWPKARMIKADQPGSWQSGIQQLSQTLLEAFPET